MKTRPCLRNISICAVVVLVFALFLHNFLRWWWTPPGIVSAPLPEYDFIIVGAGTAGCAVARRLWEGSTYSSILLIEAGGTAPFISSIPLVAPLLQGYSSDWAYKTVPQEDSQYGMKNRISSWPRGKVLGGSSVLNFMVHMWGTRADFDENWAHVGTEYSFRTVQEYYQRVENYQGSYVSEFRGTSGPMAVQELNNSSPLAFAFLNGATDMGIKNGDLNGELEDGVMLSQSNIMRGSRVSTFEAYLRPILKSSTIQLLINSMVTKIVFHDKTAIGVDVLDLANRKTYHVRAKKEIILCAGTIGSPHILMLSGVGPKEHLKEHRIPIVADLPGVGRNLHDHLNVPMYFHLDEEVSITAKKAKSLSEIFRYMFKKEGFLAHSGVEVIVRLPVPDEKPSVSKMYFMVLRLGTVDETVFTDIANYKKDIFDETFPDSKNQSKEGFIIMTSCTHPHSRGVLYLKSSVPEIHPHIDPRYLSYKKDTRCYINAMRMAAKLGTTFPLRKMGARLHVPKYKACSNYNQSIYDDDYLECWVRTAGITGYHPLGTCSIGPHDDVMAVLDNVLKVRGVRHLRVIDGSAFPYPVGGNPHASVLMLAEKGAEYILKNLQKSY